MEIYQTSQVNKKLQENSQYCVDVEYVGEWSGFGEHFQWLKDKEATN